jgi:hypothetical protein
VAPSTVREILKKHGIDRAPRRSGPMWVTFLSSQAEAIIACDFFTVDLLDGAKAHVMAVIEHATRRIHILGATARPTHEWVTQQARNLPMDLDESAERIRFLIRDRDIRYPPSFDAVLADAGIRTVRSAVRAAHERGHGTLDRRMPPRTARPHTRLEPATPAPHSARLRNPPQHPRPAHGTGQRSTGQAAASRSRRPRQPSAPESKTGSAV